ncbi:MAG: M48 family metalloprotease [Phycisphaeraceae bacterium]|nr:M48 family metalloprotease [Phycisphaeraceae bacterium]
MPVWTRRARVNGKNGLYGLWGHKLWRLRRRARVATILGAMLLLTGLTGCQVDPVTGKRQFNTLSESQEIAKGSQYAPEYEKAFGGQVDDPQVRQYVTDLGNKLAQVSHRPDMPWQFYVVDSSVVNAFALPGGHVFLTRGLMEKLDSEAEVAAVLGHEIGHVTHKHAGQQMAREMVLQGTLVGLAVVADVRGADLRSELELGQQVGTIAFLLPFSRQHENEADGVGLQYLEKAGYDPMAMATLLDKLAAESKGGQTPLFLSTHPYPEDRARKVRQYVASHFADQASRGVVNATAYQQTIRARLAKLPTPRHNPAAGE